MGHLSREVIAEQMDGGSVPGAAEHIERCVLCRAELAAMRGLRTELRSLPVLDPPPDAWPAIEARVTGRPSAAPAMPGWPRRLALQVAGIAAVFLMGFGLGRLQFDGASSVDGGLADASSAPGTVSEAMADVQRQSAAYEASLRRLEQVAGGAGVPVSAVAEERLAALDVLVEASRTALAVDPADPVLNAYLFAALEQREEVAREAALTGRAPDTEVLWR